MRRGAQRRWTLLHLLYAHLSWPTYISHTHYFTITTLPGGCCSVAKLCLTLCNPINCSTPGFPVLHYLQEFAQTHFHWVIDAIQPSHPLSPHGGLHSFLNYKFTLLRGFFLKIYLFILFYFWLDRVLVVAWGLSFVLVSGDYSSFWCAGFSFQGLLCCGAWAIREQASVAAHGL